ncbi:MAG: Crp/Fnr family transcriptional regulator [Actinomycetia bacterium]|nr:Crp/Fnr family transcriptional regulator [Actinomycetes bacterium]
MPEMQNILPLIKRSPLFNGIAENQLEALVNCLGCRFVGYRKGQTIYFVGDHARGIGIIVYGSVHVIKNDAWGNSNIIAEVSSGEMFAEAFVCGGISTMPVTVLAAADALVCFIDFSRIISTCPNSCAFHSQLISNMLCELAHKVIMLTDKIEHITKRSIREKLLSYLSEQSKTQQQQGFDVPFNRQELADYLSVDRSALSAEMSRMKADGLIDYHKNHFVLFG